MDMFMTSRKRKFVGESEKDLTSCCQPRLKEPKVSHGHRRPLTDIKGDNCVKNLQTDRKANTTLQKLQRLPSDKTPASLGKTFQHGHHKTPSFKNVTSSTSHILRHKELVDSRPDGTTSLQASVTANPRCMSGQPKVNGSRSDTDLNDLYRDLFGEEDDSSQNKVQASKSRSDSDLKNLYRDLFGEEDDSSQNKVDTSRSRSDSDLRQLYQQLFGEDEEDSREYGQCHLEIKDGEERTRRRKKRGNEKKGLLQSTQEKKERKSLQDLIVELTPVTHNTSCDISVNGDIDLLSRDQSKHVNGIRSRSDLDLKELYLDLFGEEDDSTDNSQGHLESKEANPKVETDNTAQQREGRKSIQNLLAELTPVTDTTSHVQDGSANQDINRRLSIKPLTSLPAIQLGEVTRGILKAFTKTQTHKGQQLKQFNTPRNFQTATDNSVIKLVTSSKALQTNKNYSRLPKLTTLPLKTMNDNIMTELPSSPAAQTIIGNNAMAKFSSSLYVDKTKTNPRNKSTPRHQSTKHHQKTVTSSSGVQFVAKKDVTDNTRTISGRGTTKPSLGHVVTTSTMAASLAESVICTNDFRKSFSTFKIPRKQKQSSLLSGDDDTLAAGHTQSWPKAQQSPRLTGAPIPTRVTVR